MKVLVINGPNLNMLGSRDSETYGDINYLNLKKMIIEYADTNDMNIDIYQSNNEGDIIDRLHLAYLSDVGGIVINPGAYSHYSIAIRDALEMFKIPIIEVHISNIYAREEFRHKSIIAPICLGQISGLGTHGYILALEKIKQLNL